MPLRGRARVPCVCGGLGARGAAQAAQARAGIACQAHLQSRGQRRHVVDEEDEVARTPHDARTSTSTLERFARAPVLMISSRATCSDVTALVWRADLISAPAPRATGTGSGEVRTSTDQGWRHQRLRFED
jgi:hypothetical protein